MSRSGFRALLLSGLLLQAPVALAAEPTAAEVAHKAREQGSLNLTGLKADMKLVNVEKDGTAREKSLTTQSRKIDGLAATITRFKGPPDVAGVALLVMEGKDGADQISLYAPKVRRARRIAQSSRGDSFMESEFSYADFSGGGIEEKSSKLEKDSVVDGKPCFVLVGTPADSPYAKVIAHVEKATFVPLKVEYFDAEGLKKTYSVQRLAKQPDGRMYAAESTMENARTGRKSKVVVDNVAPADAPESAFTERALERG